MSKLSPTPSSNPSNNPLPAPSSKLPAPSLSAHLTTLASIAADLLAAQPQTAFLGSAHSALKLAADNLQHHLDSQS
jgi:hypothetical protein